MKKVLIVDDSRSIRNEVTDALSPAGFKVIAAEDGPMAFVRLAEHPDIGLVILDVNMPGMSGLDVLESLQRDHITHPPVVMLTTEAERSLVERAKKAGAKAWLLKPFKPNLLAASVQRLCQ
jgi:two-component system, chemotaxis family, chemotaxis protein CheY